MPAISSLNVAKPGTLSDTQPTVSKDWKQQMLICWFVTMRHYASTLYAIVMCLSVCVSVTCWYCVKMAKCKITLTTTQGLSLLVSKVWVKFKWRHPNRGAKCRRG